MNQIKITMNDDGEWAATDERGTDELHTLGSVRALCQTAVDVGSALHITRCDFELMIAQNATNADYRDLGREAASAGDAEGDKLAELAIAGDEDARDECLAQIAHTIAESAMWVWQA